MNPCWKCVERIFGCHAGCARYNEWKEAHEAERKRIQREKDKEYDIDDYTCKRQERARKATK